MSDYDEAKGEVEVRPFKGMGLDGKEKKCLYKMSELHPHDPSHSKDLNDIADIDNLHEAPLLDLLRRRYNSDRIYTNTGNILISVNPYKSIEGMYELPSDEVLKARATKATSDFDDYDRNKEKLPPHVFTLANETYLALMDTGLCQSVLLSGESGAGKTEACKKIIAYLSAISHVASGGGEGGGDHKVEDVVVQSSPVLK